MTETTVKFKDCLSEQKLDQLKKDMGVSNVRMMRLWDAINKSGRNAYDLLGLGKETVQMIYQKGKQKYQNGQFEEAGRDFRSLMLLDHSNPIYPYCMGSCLVGLGEWAKAAMMFSRSCDMDQRQPRPYFHAADCWIRLNKFSLARYCLKQTMRAIAEHEERVKEKGKEPSEEYISMKVRSAQMLEALQSLEPKKSDVSEEEVEEKIGDLEAESNG